ncbi:MAG: putative zinc-binding protein [Candidatus Bathyarchaeia archaeon]
MSIPKIGLVACNSGASNTGYLTGLAALEVVKKFGSEVGICSLPALANNISRQIVLVKKIKHLIVIDGCRNECSRKILNTLGIKYEKYLNLEYDLQITKLGPFTTLNCSGEDVEKVSSAIIEKIKEIDSISLSNFVRPSCTHESART